MRTEFTEPFDLQRWLKGESAYIPFVGTVTFDRVEVDDTGTWFVVAEKSVPWYACGLDYIQRGTSTINNCTMRPVFQKEQNTEWPENIKFKILMASFEAKRKIKKAAKDRKAVVPPIGAAAMMVIAGKAMEDI